LKEGKKNTKFTELPGLEPVSLVTTD